MTFFDRVERFFGFKCGLDEWKKFFEAGAASEQEGEQNISRCWTFGALAEFIADRAPVAASFDPLPMLGAPCKSAGVFLGIQQVARKAGRTTRTFGPSSRITEMLRGKNLDRFWMQLRWMTEHAIPELPWHWRMLIGHAWLTAVVLIVFSWVVTYYTREPIYLALFGLLGIFLCVSAASYQWVRNPLPYHIQTFRDLVVVIVEAQK